MLGRAFLIVSAAFVLILGYAFVQDASRPYAPIQQKYYAAEGVAYPGAQIYQLFPKVKVNGEFKVERCITCHVPDVQKLGPQEAAKKLGPNHPAVIDDAIFARYGEDTSACRPSAAAATAGQAQAPSPTAGASPTPQAPRPSPSPPRAAPTPAPVPAPGTSAPRCLDPNGVPYQLFDANQQPVTDARTGAPVVVPIPGFIPRQYKGLGIDETGCIICHNGSHHGTTIEGAHHNLIPNPFAVFDTAPQLYETRCAQCHGATGEGLKGPPLNDQDRLGFFTDEYYHKCIYLGNRDPERKGTIMPPWGITKLLPPQQVELLTHWIRLYQDYKRLP